jgi:glutamate dehydrogenase/leucine dehydrogenase
MLTSSGHGARRATSAVNQTFGIEMELFELMKEHGHEQVVFWSDPSVGYKGIIAIHNTTLGPALGGTRFWNYATEEEALIDVLRLAKGMTYKAAVSGLNLGGGIHFHKEFRYFRNFTTGLHQFAQPQHFRNRAF